MKNKIPLTLVLSLFIRIGLSQGFVNFNFESAQIRGLNGNLIPATNAIPGWTAYLDATSQSSIGYDSVSAGGAVVILEDSNAPSGGGPLPLQGNYSVLLEGASGIFGSNPTTASIGQTGTIPNTAQSLTYYGSLVGTLQVTFNGQPLSFMDISNTLNYTIWGADISAYAGQTGQLLFTAPLQTGDLLDSIQFSSLPVPEPGVLGLLSLGCLAFIWHRRKAKAV